MKLPGRWIAVAGLIFCAGGLAVTLGAEVSPFWAWFAGVIIFGIASIVVWQRYYSEQDIKKNTVQPGTTNPSEATKALKGDSNV